MSNELKLSDGRTLVIDLNKITNREWRQLWDRNQSDEDGDVIVGRMVGLSGDEIADLPVLDYKRLIAKVLQVGREPLADPN